MPEQTDNLATLQPEIAMAFPTPIATHLWPEAETDADALRELVLAEEAASHGLERSNVDAWHSSLEFLNRPDPPIRRLVQKIQQVTSAMTRAITIDADRVEQVRYSIQGWANVLRDGGYNMVHNHPECVWSGVYFVALGSPTDRGKYNGKLELLDPRQGINVLDYRGTVQEWRQIIDPTPGRMVVFPSWLNHFVHPFHGSGERISIAFNVAARSRVDVS